MEQQEEQRRKQIDAERARLDREREERERQRHLQEQEEIQKRVAKDRLEQLQKSDIGKAFENVTVEARYLITSFISSVYNNFCKHVKSNESC